MANEQEQERSQEAEIITKELVATLGCIERYRRFIFTPLMEQPLAELIEAKSRLNDVVRSRSPVQETRAACTWHDILMESAEELIKAAELLISTPDDNFRHLIMQVMRGFRITCRVLEHLFPFHLKSDLLNQHLMEPGAGLPDGMPETEMDGFGLFHVGLEKDSYGRGSVSFYIPDTVPRGERRPLIIASHANRNWLMS